ncbi:polycomb group protein EMBRYONIC FLOWER 2 isoform X1 [Gossypium australe]|uniref:Polycomb group protein EMBRYONIC FLOWER 2 isoform X1 n=1 Tax=Gossypium australe TaxID=47621 RepID=A0A5B6UWT3_9ROSI|nr:polycomb group protein EMBRYONIC FLOWER 2 isoform X1 [Gossypium australe]KAA3458176.1 polycomb group protein EMBRYONIC FLOWER 2 isoform X1 [Gossypium australe]
MPGIPLVARETSSYSRSTDQMCQEDSGLNLSAEEEIAAEESLSVYCKPVELYNILQRRAIRNPLFLQRCLRYKLQAKHKRRIQMTVSVAGIVNEGVLTQTVFPLYILLARLVSDVAVAEYSAVYRFRRACILTSFTGIDDSNQAQVNFILPEINKLAMEAKSGSLAILLVSFANGGCCLWGRIPVESLYLSWEKSPNLSSGQRSEMVLPVDLQSCLLKVCHHSFLLKCSNEDKFVSIQSSSNSSSANQPLQLQVIISAKEVGVKEKSPYNSYTCSGISSSSLPHIIGLRAGNVIFNYRYYNNKLQRTEVTEDFSCPFCLVKCASFKGLRHHLPANHDLFNFEFWVCKTSGSVMVTEEYQAVNVSVKTDSWRSELVADGVDPKQQTFIYYSRRRRQKGLVQNARHVHPVFLESNVPAGGCELFDKAHGGNIIQNGIMGALECAEHLPSSSNVAGLSGTAGQSYSDSEHVQSVSGNNLGPPALQFAKTRKISMERSDPRKVCWSQNCWGGKYFIHYPKCLVATAIPDSGINVLNPVSIISLPVYRTFLRKRQFFHSHRAQPMAIDQVTSDRDSEDEVDDDVADFEDRRIALRCSSMLQMLDDFVDVTKDEKQIMHLWNSFVRKQRVLADGHIPWACEAFSKLHGQDLVKAPALIWCWRLFMTKLWNHGLLDARTMNNCNIILQQYKKNDSDSIKG